MDYALQARIANKSVNTGNTYASVYSLVPTVDLGKQEFEWLVYSPNKAFQLMSSLLVGKVTGRKNLSELAEMYLEYISDIEPGARSDVDAIRSIIPQLVV